MIAMILGSGQLLVGAQIGSLFGQGSVSGRNQPRMAARRTPGAGLFAAATNRPSVPASIR